MAKKAVFGIAKSESQAIIIADNLRAAGFTQNDVSVLFPDKQGTKDFAHEQHTKAPEGRRLAQAVAQSWAERWAGWLVSGRWRFQGSEPLSQQVLSWQPWQAQLAAQQPEDLRER
jgi:hypothetical protein